MSDTEAGSSEGGGSLAPDGTFQIARKDYSDGRAKGDYRTRYSGWAWLQIVGEAGYLSALILFSAAAVLLLAWRPQVVLDTVARILRLLPLEDAPNTRRIVQLWLTVFFSGVLGGATFAFKWLYHSLSWDEWNRDRVVWRLSVPILGGLLAVFTGCMVMSGIIPLLTKELFSRLISCAGFGFFVGLFADNFLAALQKFAAKILGTLGKST